MDPTEQAIVIAKQIIERDIDPGTGATRLAMMAGENGFEELKVFASLASSWDEEPGARDIVALEIRSQASRLIVRHEGERPEG